MMEIRQIRKTELIQAITLADKTFRGDGQPSMGDSFPQIFATPEVHSFGAFDGEKLVSFIGVVPALIHINDATLKVFSIGSVCTDEAFRGRGISTKILKEVYQYIEEQEASLLLISGDRGMYMRNNCYHFGKTTQYTITQNNLSHVAYPGVIREGDSNDAQLVNKLRKKSQVHFEASVQEWLPQLESGGFASVHNLKQQLYVAEKDDKLEGYIVVGLSEGKDKSIVTEWGGEPEVVRSIILKVLDEEEMSQIRITIPWHEKYNEVFTEFSHEALYHGGSIYLVNLARLLHQAKQYLNEKDADLAKKLTIEKMENEKYRLSVDDQSILVNEKELIQFLFSPDSSIKFNDVNKLFPIPLPSPEGMYYV